MDIKLKRKKDKCFSFRTDVDTLAMLEKYAEKFHTTKSEILSLGIALVDKYSDSLLSEYENNESEE